MTRGDIVSRALSLLGDTTLTTDAQNWLDDILLEIESVGYWKFLLTEKTYSISTSTSTFTLSGVGINDFSKGLSISIDGSGDLVEIPVRTMKSIWDNPSDGTPSLFSFDGSTITLYPPTSNATLKISYFKQIPLPTADTDDIETLCRIKHQYHSMLIDGVVSRGLFHIDDSRYALFRKEYIMKLLNMLKSEGVRFGSAYDETLKGLQKEVAE